MLVSLTEIDRMLTDAHVIEVVSKAQQVLEHGSEVYYKWTCRGCGERAIANQPNALRASWLHEDCGYITKTVDGDLGFLLVIAPKLGEKE